MPKKDLATPSIIAPPNMPATAMNDPTARLPMPLIPWPLVQPAAILAPPTSKKPPRKLSQPATEDDTTLPCQPWPRKAEDMEPTTAPSMKEI